MKSKYTVVFEDGCISHKAWDGSAIELLEALECDGYQPTAIFRYAKPLWTREGKEI